ncbi:exportin-5-like [Argiope bruennichi]|uniref:exportin-5-like n=1 Tax=Argiope bruennichi TaxID=94029 RepID=UPI0024950EF7|nr:exportin-5-like [Argiope bruennichi]
MESEIKKVSEDIVNAVNLIMNPTTPEINRRKAHELLENFKDTSPICAKCGFFLIVRSNPPIIRHFGYQLIENYVKLHWNDINDDEKVYIKNTSMQTLASGTGPVLEEEMYIKDAMSRVIVELIKREWPQHWTSLMEELHNICRLGDAQTELVLLIFSRLTDDIVKFQNIPEKRRREMYMILSNYVHDLFNFFHDTLTEKVQKYIAKNQCNITDTETITNCRIIQVTLETLSTFVDWAPMHNITEKRPLFSLLCRLLGYPELRIHAVKCLLNVLDRKGKPSDRNMLLFFFEETDLFKAVINLDIYCQDHYLFFKEFLQCLLALTSNLCATTDLFPTEIPENFSLYLNCVVLFTRHPSVVLGHLAQIIWLHIFRNAKLSSDEFVKNLVPTLLKYEAEKLIKCGYPSKSDCLACKFSLSEFDSDDEFEIEFSKCRSDVLENLRLISKGYPKVTFSFGSLLLKSLINGQEWKTVLDNPIAVMYPPSCWDAIVSYMDASYGVLMKNIEIPEVKELMNEGLELLNLALNFIHNDPVILSFALSCISSLFFFITFQPELRLQVLEKIFSYLTDIVREDSSNKDVVNLRRHSSALLIKLCMNFPDMLLPEWDYLCNRVQTLLQSGQSTSRFEKCALLESLMILSTKFHDYEKQSSFLKAALSSIDHIWTSPVILQGIESPGSFMSLIGMDKPHDASIDSGPMNINASDLMLGINVLKACAKRCVCPNDSVMAHKGNFIHPLSDSFGCTFYRNPAAPYILLIIDKIIHIISILNELYDPVYQEKIHPSYQRILDLTDADKTILLGIPVIENSHLKTSSDHMRFYLHNMFDSCLHILGCSVENLGIDFYTIPELPTLLKEKILHKIEYMPPLKLRNLIRLFLRPFFLRCPPKAHDELMSVLAGLCPFMLQKLNAVWEKFKYKYGTCVNYEDKLTENEEIIEDQLHRTLSREYINFLVELLTKQDTCSVNENEMESDKKDTPINHSKCLTDLGIKILQTESVRPIFICTAFDSLRWLDTTTNIKAIQLSELVFNKIMEDGLIRQIQEANYLLQSVLYALQELGEHEGNLSLLLSFGLNVYENLRQCFIEIQTTFMNSVGCNQQSLRKLNETLTQNLPKAKSDKMKKEAFKTAIEKIIGKNIGQRHKKEVVIKNLPPLIYFKPKKDSSLLDFDLNSDMGLCNLFSSDKNC